MILYNNVYKLNEIILKMEKNSRIYIAGHKGLVGSAIVRILRKEGFTNLILRTSSELDLRNQKATEEFLEKEKPEYVFDAAAKVGGIRANMTYPAEFVYDNLQIQNNIIHSSWKNGVKKLLFLGSACIYPRECTQPIKEEYLLTNILEPTNEPYAVAKISGIKMCQAYNKQHGTNFISVMPTNLFGPEDNFDPINSHIVAALIRKFHEAKIQNKDEVTLWGTGTPKRDIIYVDDVAQACLFLMQNYNSSDIINIGTGKDLSVREIAGIVKDVVGFKGKISFDATKPDGMMRRILDISKINALGWKAETDIKEGIKKTYDWFLKNEI